MSRNGVSRPHLVPLRPRPPTGVSKEVSSWKPASVANLHRVTTSNNRRTRTRADAAAAPCTLTCAWAVARLARTHRPPQGPSAAPPIFRLLTSTSPPATQHIASRARHPITAPSPAAPAAPAKKAIVTRGDAVSVREIASASSDVAVLPRRIVMLSARAPAGPRAEEAGVRRRVRVRVFGYFENVGDCAHFMKIGFSFFPFFFSLFFCGLGWDSFGRFLFFFLLYWAWAWAWARTWAWILLALGSARVTSGPTDGWGLCKCYAIYLLSISVHLIYIYICLAIYLSIDAPFPIISAISISKLEDILLLARVLMCLLVCLSSSSAI